MQPLKNDSKTAKMVPEVFANVEKILSMNRMLQQQLEERIAHFSPSETIIGDVFLNLVSWHSLLCCFSLSSMPTKFTFFIAGNFRDRI
jgi:hypothetical protein